MGQTKQLDMTKQNKIYKDHTKPFFLHFSTRQKRNRKKIKLKSNSTPFSFFFYKKMHLPWFFRKVIHGKINDEHSMLRGIS